MEQIFGTVFNLKNVKDKGFTSIEKIFSVVILFLVLSFIFVQVNPIKKLQAYNDMKRKNDLKNISNALEVYYRDFGKYPKSSPDYQIIDFKTNKPIPWGFAWEPFMEELPKDTGSRHYVYFSSSDFQSYWLYTNLELASEDSQSCSKGVQCYGINQNNIRTDACGTGIICNFGISSKNVSP